MIFAYFLTALEFQPTAPAKLATAGPLSVTLDGRGCDGSVTVFARHYNDRIGAWCDLSDVPNAWTSLGSLTASGSLSFPAFSVGPNEKILLAIGFQPNANLPAPILTALSLPWTSDVTAPSAPSIASFVKVIPAGAAPGYRVDFDVPAGARHAIVEGKLNGGAWVQFSNRAKMEASAAYMLFRGDVSAVEAAGERNETHLSFAKGLTAGDVVQVRVAAEDASGNRSAFVASDPVTLTADVVVPSLYLDNSVLAAGGTGTVTVHLVGKLDADLTVDYATAEGTATDPRDFAGVSGTLTFAADDLDHRVQTIAINATGAEPPPSNRAYTVVLSNTSGGATIERATGTVTIIAGDVPTLWIEDAVLKTGTTGTVRVHLIGKTRQDVAVDYAAVADTATTPADFADLDGTLTFEADAGEIHQTQTITVNASGTSPAAIDVAYKVRLSGQAGGAVIERADGVISIQNIPYLPVFSDPISVSVAERDTVEVSIP